MAIKTIFLDRDGVVNKEVGYLHKIEDFKFIEGIFEACFFFLQLDYQIIIVSNQSGIKKNISILDTFYCPHGPDSDCRCRKPMPGMLFEAKKKYNIDMNWSWMIGDKETDIEAANLAGINNTILVRSGHSIDEDNSKSKFIVNSIKDSKNIIKI